MDGLRQVARGAGEVAGLPRVNGRQRVHARRQRLGREGRLAAAQRTGSERCRAQFERNRTRGQSTEVRRHRRLEGHAFAMDGGIQGARELRCRR